MSDPGPMSRAEDLSKEIEHSLKVKNENGGTSPIKMYSNQDFNKQDVFKRLIFGYSTATLLALGTLFSLAWVLRSAELLSADQWDTIFIIAWWYAFVPVVLLFIIIPFLWPFVFLPVAYGGVFHWLFMRKLDRHLRRSHLMPVDFSSVFKELAPINIVFAVLPIPFLLIHAFFNLTLNPFPPDPNPALISTLVTAASLTVLSSTFGYIFFSYFACKGPVDKMLRLRELGQYNGS